MLEFREMKKQIKLLNKLLIYQPIMSKPHFRIADLRYLNMLNLSFKHNGMTALLINYMK